MSLDDCWDNCTEGEEGKIPDEKMLELCGREMNEQELHEVENYRQVLSMGWLSQGPRPTQWTFKSVGEPDW